MDINRNNYEEYFILYADNELTNLQKKEVECFVEINKDLQQEFNMFQMTVQSADEEIAFPLKNSLYKESGLFIDETNYEEKFILYHDAELNKDKENKVNEFLANNPQFLTEFNLFSQSKLIADEHIVFDKKQLLLKDEPKGKVVPLIYWRALAAAMIAGLGIWFSFSYLNQSKISSPAIATAPITKSINQVPEIKTNEKDSSNLQIANSNKEASESYAVVEKVIPKSSISEVKEKKPSLISVEKKEVVASVAQVTQKITIPDKIKINEPQIQVSKTIDNSTSLAVNDAPLSINGKMPSVQIDKEIKPDEAQNYATRTVNENAETNENYIFYNVKNQEFNKTKVGGFLRKLKRIVERTNPIARMLSGDDKEIARK